MTWVSIGQGLQGYIDKTKEGSCSDWVAARLPQIRKNYPNAQGRIKQCRDAHEPYLYAIIDFVIPSEDCPDGSMATYPDSDCKPIPDEPKQCEASTSTFTVDFPLGSSPTSAICEQGCSADLFPGAFACDDTKCFGAYSYTGDSCDGTEGSGGSGGDNPGDGGSETPGGGHENPDPPNPDPTPNPNPGGDGGSDGGGTGGGGGGTGGSGDGGSEGGGTGGGGGDNPGGGPGGGGGGDNPGGGGSGDGSGEGNGDGNGDGDGDGSGEGEGGGTGLPGKADNPWKEILDEQDIKEMKDKEAEVKEKITKKMDEFRNLFNVPVHTGGGSITPVQFTLNHGGGSVQVKNDWLGRISADISSVIILIASVLAFLIVTRK
ncbi:hypothetical protein [Photobacterium ganghwense]|uniref:hypothetical protein n=1 Tax=Photobacterium ganghwense TaxID=320778 RepID=UPI0039EE47E0